MLDGRVLEASGRIQAIWKTPSKERGSTQVPLVFNSCRATCPALKPSR